MLTADTVLGRGTTVIDNEDGSLRDYLESLRRLHGLGRAHGAARPRAGPARPRGRHRDVPRRTARSGSTRCATRCGRSATTPPPAQIVEHVYTDVDEKLWDAAEWSVQAQLDYLRA